MCCLASPKQGNQPWCCQTWPRAPRTIGCHRAVSWGYSRSTLGGRRQSCWYDTILEELALSGSQQVQVSMHHVSDMLSHPKYLLRVMGGAVFSLFIPFLANKGWFTWENFWVQILRRPFLFFHPDVQIWTQVQFFPDFFHVFILFPH